MWRFKLLLAVKILSHWVHGCLRSFFARLFILWCSCCQNYNEKEQKKMSIFSVTFGLSRLSRERLEMMEWFVKAKTRTNQDKLCERVCSPFIFLNITATCFWYFTRCERSTRKLNGWHPLQLWRNFFSSRKLTNVLLQRQMRRTKIYMTCAQNKLESIFRFHQSFSCVAQI